MKVAAVTGASGHLGANLVRALLADGWRVRCLVRRDTRALDGLPVDAVPGDVLVPGSLDALCVGADTVFHLAALISLSGDAGGEVDRVNVQGTRHVLEAARRAGVRRLVHAGTIHTRWADPGHPSRGTPYDRSKAGAETLVLEAGRDGLETVVLAPTGVIGPQDWKPSRTGDLLQRLSVGRMPALVRAGFDWVDARDVALAAVRSATAGRPGTAYVLSGHYATLRDLAALVEDASGVPAPRLSVPLGVAALAAPFAGAWARLRGTPALFTSESLAALRQGRAFPRAEAERDLDHVPRPLAETVADTLAWFRSADGGAGASGRG